MINHHLFTLPVAVAHSEQDILACPSLLLFDILKEEVAIRFFFLLFFLYYVLTRISAIVLMNEMSAILWLLWCRLR